MHLGGRAEELIGTAGAEAVVRRVTPQNRARVEAGLKAGLFTGVVKLERPDGEVCWLDLRVREHGSLQYGTGRDVTHAELERQYAEAELRKSERRLRAILDSCPDGVWLGDLEGRSLWVNRRLSQLLGYDEHELLGRSMLEFIGEGYEQARAGLHSRQRGSTSPAVYEVMAKTRDRGSLWVRASTAAMCDEERRPTGIVCVISELPELRLTESLGAK